MPPRETGEIFLVECPVIGGISRRTKVVLLKIIQERVHPGTTIFTDGWAAYRDLPLLGVTALHITYSTLLIHSLYNTFIITPLLPVIGYEHKWVNHDQHYVDPDTGVHTNRIESR